MTTQVKSKNPVFISGDAGGVKKREEKLFL
jgi:hypothetical protein